MSDTQMSWLSTKAAAEYLGITTRTLYRLIDDGQMPAYKFGRVIRLQQDDVHRFIEASRVEPGSLKHLYPDPRAEGAGEEVDEGVEGNDPDEPT